ncbi:MAG: hypothetical protein KC416_13340, partial [Myxococcales bacterium]|nr:hypothetical protein [Myxococcales bacterium]
MGIDERLFGWLHQTLKRNQGKAPELGAHAVSLDSIADRLAILASALAGRPFSVQEAEGEGGVRGAVLLLPRSFDLTADRSLNVSAYLYRVAYGVTLDRIRPRSGELEVARDVCAALEEDLPPTRQMLEGLLQATVGDEGRKRFERFREGGLAAEDLGEITARLSLLFGRLIEAPAEVDGGVPSNAEGGAPSSGGTERQAPRRDEVEVVELSKNREDENPLVHSFEKVHTLDDYQGGTKRQDGEDHLVEEMAALEELDLRQVVRTGETAQSVYRADGLFEGIAGDAGEDGANSTEPHLEYDEWDAKGQAYRRGYCRLFLERAVSPVSDDRALRSLLRVRREHAPEAKRLRSLFEGVESEKRWRGRQLDGDELDIDALIDRAGSVSAGRTPTDRVYARRKRNDRDIATMILLDLSLSSDSWVQNRRILEVTQDAVALLGDALDGVRDAFAVAGFRSHTRRDCRWLTL